MNCPHCKAEHNGVVLETRKQDGDILRKRACGKCGKFFLTAEKADLSLVMRRFRADKLVTQPIRQIPKVSNRDVFNVWSRS